MKRYTFTLEETQEIKAARKKNRDKNVEKRLAALEMRAEGKQNKEIREKTGFQSCGYAFAGKMEKVLDPLCFRFADDEP